MARSRCPRHVQALRDAKVASFSSRLRYFDNADVISGAMEQWVEENDADGFGSPWKCHELEQGILYAEHSDGLHMLLGKGKETSTANCW